MRRWSAVRYGSHSAPFSRIVSIGRAGLRLSLMNVGKVAPPCPTRPPALIFWQISSGSKLVGSTPSQLRSRTLARKLSGRGDPSVGKLSPMAGMRRPFGRTAIVPAPMTPLIGA